MRLFTKAKDGGHRSPVDAFFLIEIKRLFSIALLRFSKGGRENYHTHAFNALTWFIKGKLKEQNIDGSTHEYRRSIVPKLTPKNQNHRVIADRVSWCLTLRGPWEDSWTEYNEKTDTTTVFTHGRKVVDKKEERYE